MAENFHNSMANCYLIIKLLQLFLMDLTVMKIIRHEIFVEVFMKIHENHKKIPYTKVSIL